MLATIEDVKTLTNYDVTLTDITLAQGIIETFVGLLEADVTDPNDRAAMGRAVCYQAAYVSKNFETVFEQMAVRSMSQTDSSVVLDTDLGSPYLSALALFAIRNLSGRGSRSIKTGTMFGREVPTPWELD
jgi:hypothetical protein